MLYARGRLLLFADADGATKFSDITKLESEMKHDQRRQVGCFSEQKNDDSMHRI